MDFDIAVEYADHAIHYHIAALRRLPYPEYLLTRHWERKRRLAIERAGYRCEKCGFRYFLEVHHLTYERLGCEQPEDLMALCRTCHRGQHSGANNGNAVG
jgi:5-methylcytosine-specific restriction endonuclease McrA